MTCIHSMVVVGLAHSSAGLPGTWSRARRALGGATVAWVPLRREETILGARESLKSGCLYGRRGHLAAIGARRVAASCGCRFHAEV